MLGKFVPKVCWRKRYCVLYDKASRWWGKAFTDDCSKGEMVELDVVAESL